MRYYGNDDELIVFTGFDDCILGVVARFGMEPVVAYDRDKCIRTLVERDGMTWEEAEEYFSFNVIGAWVGEMTPAFVELGVLDDKLGDREGEAGAQG